MKYVCYIPSLQILNARYSPLCISYHLAKEIGETGFAELCISGPIEVSIVDGFAIRGDAEAGGYGLLGRL